MFELKLIVSLSFLMLVVSEDLDSLIYHYEQLFVEYDNNATKYQFPKDNAEFFDNITDNSIKDYGTYDFIIVGAGSSGTVLANRLTETSEFSVLLIEAGGKEDDYSDIPNVYANLQSSRMNWGYLTTPQSTCCLGMKNNQCPQPRGKVMGGSGSINTLMYVRGNKKDFDNWERMGNKGWSYEKVLPYFKKCENFTLYSDKYHGNNGLLQVSYSEPPSKLLETFKNANEELGREELDYNGINQLGYARTQMNLRNGRRVSGGNSYIRPIRYRSNLKISTNSLVTRLIINSVKPLKVEGVEFIKDKLRYKARASKEVILAAGVYNSPQILLLSGIGPAEELSKLNITVVHDSPAVGKNLKDHPMHVGLYFRSNFIQNINSTEDMIRSYLQGEGPLTCPGAMYGIGFIETKDKHDGIPDIEYIFHSPGSFVSHPNIYYNFKDDLLVQYTTRTNNERDFMINVVLLHPKSTGDTTLKSNNPRDFPNININYFSDEQDHDIGTMYKGIQFILKLTETEAFKKIETTRYAMRTECDALGVDTKEYWYCYIRTITATIYHPTGTTRMGPTPKNSVVNDKLIVYGTRNLRVVDAGVIPSPISGHTGAAAFMIGEKASDMIKEKYGKL